MGNYVTIDEAVQQTGYTIAWIYRLIATNEIKAVRREDQPALFEELPRHKVLIVKRSLNKHMARTRRGPTPRKKQSEQVA